MNELLAAAMGGGFAFVVVVLQQWFTRRQNREDALWQKRIEKLDELEAKAGLVLDKLSISRRLVPLEYERVQEKIAQLDISIGMLQRYESIIQPIREFQHMAEVLSVGLANNEFDSLEERELVVRELKEQYRLLLDAIDRLGKQ